MRRKTSSAFSTALSPSHGVEPCAARPWTSRRIASTPLAWTPMCRSVGSPVIAKSPRRPRADELVGRAVVDVLGLLVGHAHEAHAHARPARRSRERAHHRREAALHVVGAAADQPVALDARLELLRAAGHDVEVAVEHAPSGASAAAPTVGEEHRQAVVRRARAPRSRALQPALDEAGGGAQPVGRRGVVGDQPLGEGALVDHDRDRIGDRRRRPPRRAVRRRRRLRRSAGTPPSGACRARRRAAPRSRPRPRRSASSALRAACPADRPRRAAVRRRAPPRPGSARGCRPPAGSPRPARSGRRRDSER